MPRALRHSAADTMLPHVRLAFPHEGACNDCHTARRCNYCGESVTVATRCTNGRCMTCHRDVCTPGGTTAPGHGFGTQGLPARMR